MGSSQTGAPAATEFTNLLPPKNEPMTACVLKTSKPGISWHCKQSINRHKDCYKLACKCPCHGSRPFREHLIQYALDDRNNFALLDASL
jgi:hypothetical protein